MSTNVKIWTSLFVIASLVAHLLYRRFRRASLDCIKGPPSDSWLYGNVDELMTGQVGDPEFSWFKEYGKIVKLKAPFGQNMLLVSDPKAIQYIVQTGDQSFGKDREMQVIVASIFGQGLATVEGDAHRRQRKVMTPAFSASQTKNMVSVFSKHATKLVEKWHAILDGTVSSYANIDAHSWISRATLDAMGEAAFGYQFGVLQNAEDELAKAFQTLIFETFVGSSKENILFMSIAQFVPIKLLSWLLESSSIQKSNALRISRRLSNKVLSHLVKAKKEMICKGTPDQDLLSLCIKANSLENPRGQMSEEELMGQLRTFILAGQETTSVTMSWALYELAQRPEIQIKLHAEIQAQRQKSSRGFKHKWTWKDFEEMSYLTAFTKEVFRLYPSEPSTLRQAVTNETVPLLMPIMTFTGQTSQHVYVPKGTKIIISAVSYNRDESIFGPDSNHFNPDRWLKADTSQKGETTSVGIFANTMSFSGGPRACIGWRFAIFEFQAFLVEMLNNFHFSHVLDPHLIRREAGAVMAPVIDGQMENKAQLPLKITAIRKEEN